MPIATSLTAGNSKPTNGRIKARDNSEMLLVRIQTHLVLPPPLPSSISGKIWQQYVDGHGFPQSTYRFPAML